jgi:hypothetical protein
MCAAFLKGSTLFNTVVAEAGLEGKRTTNTVSVVNGVVSVNHHFDEVKLLL